MAARSSNIELLRIVSMALIVMHHFAIHGSWPEGGQLGNEIFLDCISWGGKLGVNCFVIITGFFMIHSNFRIRSFLKTLFQVLFYSVAILVFFLIKSPQLFSDIDLLRYFLPSISGLYWFATCYLALYLLIPILNRLYSQLGKLNKYYLIGVGFILLSVIPTVTTFAPLNSNLIWFIFLYFIGGAIRDYEGDKQKKIELVNPVSLVYKIGPLKVVLFLTIFIWMYAGMAVCVNSYYDGLMLPRYFMSQYSTPLFLASVGLFILFKSLHIGSSKAINSVASTAFGIYLIHDNPLVRNWLWEHFSYIYNDAVYLFALKFLLIVILVFCFCSLIDFLRKKIVEVPFFRILESVLKEKFNRADLALNWKESR